MLLENGADPNATDKLESTPLHRASAKGNFRLIQLLLKQSASTNIQDSQGNTPLYVWISTCSTAVGSNKRVFWNTWKTKLEKMFSNLAAFFSTFFGDG